MTLSTHTQLDNHYVDPRLVALYDIECGWSIDRDFYLSLAEPAPKAVLDLGCGTGLLCDAYAARGHKVAGADPSAAMLGVARQKPNGGAIEWVETEAQHFRSRHRFDLITMTGQAFQVLLEDDAIKATLRAMRTHLKPGGTIAFETRNPARGWNTRWNHTFAVDTEAGSVAGRRVVTAAYGDRVNFDTHYQLPDGAKLTSHSQLRFPSRNEVERFLGDARLTITAFYGDWDRSPFDADQSDEMIFLVSA